MTFIRDEDIAAMVADTPSLAPGVDQSNFTGPRSAIQACSIDLTIGEIFLPEMEDGKLGSSTKPLKALSLAQGASAVVRTKEKLSMPDDVGGIAFPPAHVSIDGLLMTNPGHVDPGYDGTLHLTVINMGRKPYPLKRGERIVRLLPFRLNQAPAQSYRQRRPGAQDPVITEELLDKLSTDFVDVAARAEASAKKQIRNTELRSAWVPAVAAILASGLTFGLTLLADKLMGSEFEEANRRIDALSAKVDSLGGNVNLGEVQKQIDEIKKKIGQ